MGTVLKIVSWPFRMAVRNAGSTIERIKSSTALGKLLNSLSLVPMGGSIIMILVAIIMFIIQNGFGIQIDTIKSRGLWDAVNTRSSGSVWTKGTSGYFYNVWIAAFIGVIFLALTVFAAIELYKYGSKGRKTGFTISAVFLIAGIATFVFGLAAMTDAVAVPLAGLGVMSAAGIASLILLSKSSFFKSSFINTAFFFTAAPLTVLIIENIIGLVGFAIVLIIMAVAFLIFGSALTSSGSETSGSAPAATPDPAAAKALRKKHERMTQLQNEIDQCNKSIEGHAKGQLGYFGVDPKYCARKAWEKRQELEQLRAQV